LFGNGETLHQTTWRIPEGHIFHAAVVTKSLFDLSFQ
jgi:hypothetical protein